MVIEAAQNLSRHRHGALLVLERETGLEEYADTGIRLDATPSAELLEGLFYPNSPLHDGAVILRGNRVVAASCTLPLSGRLNRGHLGTRHRAALGITEHTDAVSIVISEETGDISVAASGRMISRLDGARLGAILKGLFSRRLELAPGRRSAERSDEREACGSDPERGRGGGWFGASAGGVLPAPREPSWGWASVR